MAINIPQLMEVFQAGKTVANPEAWKKGSVNVNILMVLISGIITIFHYFDCSICGIQLSTDQIVSIATAIMAIAGLFNAGSHVATTDKIGFKQKVQQDITVDDSVKDDKIQEVSEELANDIKDLQ